MRIEYDELSRRLDNLDRLLAGTFENVARKVGGKQAAMLISQRYLMKGYLDILESRIGDLENNND